MLSDLDKVQFVIENADTMTKTELVKRTGLSRTTVYRILKNHDTNNAVQHVSDETQVIIEPALKLGVPMQDRLMTSGKIATRIEIASIMTEQLASELSLYCKAVRRAEQEDDRSYMLEAVTHAKLIHSISETLGRWHGMDKVSIDEYDRKNTITRKAEDMTDDELNELLRHLSLTELIRLDEDKMQKINDMMSSDSEVVDN